MDLLAALGLLVVVPISLLVNVIVRVVLALCRRVPKTFGQSLEELVDQHEGLISRRRCANKISAADFKFVVASEADLAFED
eukprot:SAG11_NODE_7384_length_1152_cov_1.270655_1_plen_80_part_10